MTNLYRDRTTGALKTKAELVADHPSTCFPLSFTSDTLDFLGVDPVFPGAQPVPGDQFEAVVPGPVVLTDKGFYEQTYVLQDIRPTDPTEFSLWMQDYRQRRWEDIRQERNKRLLETDWTMLLDAPLSDAGRTAWANYRQALRDLPQEAEDPDAVIWPTPPE